MTAQRAGGEVWGLDRRLCPHQPWPTLTPALHQTPAANRLPHIHKRTEECRRPGPPPEALSGMYGAWESAFIFKATHTHIPQICDGLGITGLVKALSISGYPASTVPLKGVWEGDSSRVGRKAFLG